VSEFKEAIHPNAYLENIRNTRLGLVARTKILSSLDKASGDAKSIAKEAKIHYGVSMHHLKLLEAEGIVQRRSGKPYVWTPTGRGQRRLSVST
jgi:predicted transcriptional regulator